MSLRVWLLEFFAPEYFRPPGHVFRPRNAWPGIFCAIVEDEGKTLSQKGEQRKDENRKKGKRRIRRGALTPNQGGRKIWNAEQQSVYPISSSLIKK